MYFRQCWVDATVKNAVLVVVDMAVDISHDCQLIVGQQSVDRYAIISQQLANIYGSRVDQHHA